MLPDAVIQGMGWAPQPADGLLPVIPGAVTPLPSAPIPADAPVAPAAAPLPVPPPAPPPVDASLAGSPAFQAPAQQDASPATAPQPSGPVAAPQPAPQARPQGGPTKPPTIAQQQADATATQNRADATAQAALGAQTAAKLDEASGQLDAQLAYQDQQKAINEQRAKDADEKAKAVMTRQAQADAAEKKFDDYKVDQNQYWNSLGMGNHIGLYIAMALSGVGNALQGKGSEPNPVIAMIQQKAKENILAQQDERRHLGEVAQNAQAKVEQTRKLYGDKESDSLLKLSILDKNLATQLGVVAAKSADPNIRANAAAEQAKLLQSSADKKAQAVERASQHDIQNRQLGIAAGHLQLGRDQFAWQKDKDQQELDLKAAALAQKGDKRGSEEYQKFGIPGVTHADGTPFIATGEGGGVEKVREKVAAAKTMIGLLDKMRDIRTGYSNNNLASREEWQRIQQLYAAAMAKGKDALGLGALSESDFKLIRSYIGSADPTMFRDPTAGILQARDTILNDLNDTLNAHNRSGQKFKVDDLDPNPPGAPKITDEKLALNEALGPGREIQPARLGGRISGLANAGEGENVDPVSPSVRQNLETWGAMLESGNPEQAKKAADFLSQIAKTAQNDAVKARAQQLLMNVGQRTQPSAQDELPTQTGARVQAPAK